MSTVGSEQARFHFDGHDVELCGNKLTSKSGQLAGSALTMDVAVNNAIQMLGASPCEAIIMASLTPAKFLRADNEIGQLSIGSQANMVLLSQLNDLPFQVLHTWINGRLIY